MPFCDNCGTQVADNTRFCPNCGKDMTMKTVTSPSSPPQNPQGYPPNYQQPMMQQTPMMNTPPTGYGYAGMKKRTGLLTATLVLNYIVAGLLVLAGVFIIFVALALSSSYEAQLGAALNGYNLSGLTDFKILIGLIYLVIGILYIYLTYRLGKFGPTAKTIMIIVSIIFGIINLFSVDILILAVNVNTIYAIQFDQQTKLLFGP